MVNPTREASLGPVVSAVYQTKATVPACRSGTGPGGRAAEGRFRFQDYGAFPKPSELVRLREQCVPLRSELASGAVCVSFLEFPPGLPVRLVTPRCASPGLRLDHRSASDMGAEWVR